MVNNQVIQMFESKEKIQYSCYDYLELQNPLNEQFKKFFKEGLEKLLFTYSYYFNERVAKYGVVSADIDVESKSFFEQNYQFSDVEAGLTPLNIVDFHFNTHIFYHTLDHIKKGDSKGLSRNELINILREFGDLTLEPTPAKNLIKDDLKDLYETDARFRNYLMHKSFATGTDEEVLDTFFINDAISKIMGVFEKMQVIQSNDDYNLNILNWNIRSDAEIYLEDFNEASLYSGMLFLRKVALRDSLPRFSELHRSIDNLEISCLKDEFRYQFAGQTGILDISKAKKIIENEYDMNSFEAQYKTFSQTQKRLFEKRANEFLREISKEYDLPYRLGL